MLAKSSSIGKVFTLKFNTCRGERITCTLVREVKLRVLISFTGNDNPRTGCFRISYVTSSEKFNLFLMSGPPNSNLGVQLASPTRLPFFPRNAGIKSRSLYSHLPEGGIVSMVVRPPVKPPYWELSGKL